MLAAYVLTQVYVLDLEQSHSNVVANGLRADLNLE